MHNLVKLALGASTLALTAPAGAATFTFSSGNYVPGVTSPSPLLAPDILELTTGSSKFWNNVSFTNQSGTVNWLAGTLYMQNGATIFNQSLWDTTTDNGLYNNGGLLSTFTNSGIFRKSGGLGSSTIGAIAFINSGTIDAQTGAIVFSGGNATFNNGSAFTGDGAVNINANAAFNGDFTSSNLNFNAGTFTGSGAVLSGSADWTGGNVTGDWQVAGGSTLNLRGANNKFFNGADFTNNGTVNWQQGTVYLQGGSQVTNASVWDTTTDNGLYNNGGILSTFTNDGTFSKSAGAASTTISSIAFVNNGTIDAQTGAIVFSGGLSTFNAGSVFQGAGDINITSDAAFNGGFTSANLNLNSGTFTGSAAVLNGTADWTGGFVVGNWQVAGGSTLNLQGANNKFFNGADFTNNGTVNWQQGTVYLQSGGQVTNASVWDTTTDNGLYNNGGALSTFTNDGTFSKSAGATSTTISSIAFVNNGTIDAETGAIVFSGGLSTFNAGSVFMGDGAVNITSNAAFNGGFTSANLNLNSGTFTGTGAVIGGTVDWTAGFIAGGWQVGGGSTMNLQTGSAKFFNGADFTNNGTVNWQQGPLYLQGGSQVVNNDRLTITGNDGIANNGGAASSFTNAGLIEKTGGGGTTTIGDNIGFANQGAMNVLSGTIALPTNFTNDGTLAGTTRYSVAGASGLTNNGTIAPGDIGMTGTLGLSGNYLQTASGTLATQIASTVMFDLFNITGTASLDGTLALSCFMGCNINSGDIFTILNSDRTLSGMFSNVTTSGFGTGFSYDVIYDYANSEVRLSILDAGVPPPGGVPEPSVWAMFIVGFGMIGGSLRRRSARRVPLVYI